MSISKKLTIAGVAIVIILGVAILYSYIPQQTNIQTVEASVVYVNGDKSINEALPNEEALILYNIFNRKTLSSDSPSGQYSSNISIKFGDMVFCIPVDGSTTIKFQNKNKYFTVSKDDLKVIAGIFYKHGAVLPGA